MITFELKNADFLQGVIEGFLVFGSTGTNELGKSRYNLSFRIEEAEKSYRVRFTYEYGDNSIDRFSFTILKSQGVAKALEYCEDFERRFYETINSEEI